MKAWPCPAANGINIRQKEVGLQQKHKSGSLIDMPAMSDAVKNKHTKNKHTKQQTAEWL